MKTLHLHACTRTLGVDLVGLLSDGSGDLVLRSPALRPRHWATVCNSLPNNKAPKMLDALFPGRFSPDAKEIAVAGGTRLEERLQRLGQQSVNKKFQNDQASAVLSSVSAEEDEEWNDFEEEEVEALKQISSSYNVRSMDDESVDLTQSPRLIIQHFAVTFPEGKRVDALLKILLPAVRVVAEKQREDKERARVAMELRDRREALKKAKKDASKRVEFVRQENFYTDSGSNTL
jgi:hypothetical protein